MTHDDSQNSSNGFLNEFFKNNGLFEASEEKAEQNTEKHEKENTGEKKEISSKDINLKALFQTIEQEKESHSQRVKKHIEQEKPKHEHTISLIKLQSESRALFEGFLRILPIIEKEFYLDRLQAKQERESRGDQEYIPEIWETNPQAVFFDSPEKTAEKYQAAEVNLVAEEDDLDWRDQIHEIDQTAEEKALEDAIIAKENERIAAQAKAELLAEQERESEERQKQDQKQAERAKQKALFEEQEAKRKKAEAEQLRRIQEKKEREDEIERNHQARQARIAAQAAEEEKAQILRQEEMQYAAEQKRLQEKAKEEQEKANRIAFEQAEKAKQEYQEEQEKQALLHAQAERRRAAQRKKQKAEQAEQKRIREREIAELNEQKAAIKLEKANRRKQKLQAIAQHITRFGHRYLYTATEKMNTGLKTAQNESTSIFSAANKKIANKVEAFDITALLPKTPSKGSSFRGKKHYAEQKTDALARAKKRAKDKVEKKKEAGFLELLKIGSIVAALFFVSMVGLNYSAFLERYEKHWNASVFEERQQSIQTLVEESSEETTSEKKHLVPLLPVAGNTSSVKKKETFNTQLYLNVTPPDTRIIIPKIAKNIPIVEVSDESRKQENWDQLEKEIQDALQDGVVHYPGTANPGQFGNTFITGHSSYYPWDDGRYKDVFAALHDLEEGDEYYIFHKGKKYKYVISTRKVVKPSDVSVLEQDTSKKTSTLMTCTPIGTTARRLILQATQVEVE